MGAYANVGRGQTATAAARVRARPAARAIRAKTKATTTKAAARMSAPAALRSTVHVNATGPPATETASRGEAALPAPSAGRSGGGGPSAIRLSISPILA